MQQDARIIRFVCSFRSARINHNREICIPILWFVQWLSPNGCLMFSVQLHVSLDTPLGERLSLLQHLVAVAVVNTVLSIDGYEVSRQALNQTHFQSMPMGLLLCIVLHFYLIRIFFC